jgi:hypothetical protein
MNCARPVSILHVWFELFGRFGCRHFYPFEREKKKIQSNHRRPFQNWVGWPNPFLDLLQFYTFLSFQDRAVRPGLFMDSPAMLFFFCKSVLFRFRIVWFLSDGSSNSTYSIAIQPKFKCNIDWCRNLYRKLSIFIAYLDAIVRY